MASIHWTERKLAELRRHFAAGETWEAIAAALGIHDRTARAKGRELGLSRRRKVGGVCVPDTVWTPEADAIVTAGYAAGTLIADIAAALGPHVSRRVVIGRARRLGLPRHPNAAGAFNVKRSRKPEPKRPYPRTVVPVPLVAPAFGEGKPVVDAVTGLRRTQCRWIEGDVMAGKIAFCANDARTDGSYCEAHRVVCTQPQSQMPARAKQHFVFLGGRDMKRVARR